MEFLKKPDWLKVSLPKGSNYLNIKSHKTKKGLSTVCESALCPNLGECWGSGTATFMLMGDTCTRGCKFCAVKSSSHPEPLDPKEPDKITATLMDLNLKYVVLTTVNRDDLADQGANHIKKCIESISKQMPHITIEILIPDFQGETSLIDKIIASKPKVIGHNVECIERLTKTVRDPRASYRTSLNVLDHIKKSSPEIYTKSSLMLGIGETEDEIIQSMKDLRSVQTDILTMGQYLKPGKLKLDVKEYIKPEKFQYYKKKALQLGFSYVASGPLVRSSYKAAEAFIEGQN